MSGCESTKAVSVPKRGDSGTGETVQSLGARNCCGTDGDTGTENCGSTRGPCRVGRNRACIDHTEDSAGICGAVSVQYSIISGGGSVACCTESLGTERFLCVVGPEVEEAVFPLPSFLEPASLGSAA